MPTKSVSHANIGISFRAATRTPALQKLAFSGLQVAFMYYFITYAVKGIHLERVSAGQVYGVASLVAIAGQIFWGWLAGRYLASRFLLIILSIAMCISAAAVGMATPKWGIYGLAAAAIAFGATGISWNRIHLAGVARHAPAGQVPTLWAV